MREYLVLYKEVSIMNILILGLGGVGQRYLRLLKKVYSKNCSIITLRNNKLNMKYQIVLKMDKKCKYYNKI